ncbi:ABC transporter ATP-binding protein [candidate division WOR-1 bacterium RIFOXYC2_FULL_37_10]|uniref:ABC transporter ATP-binding protein n=1 Tax=candidate division WOR-1 bacterium RIFOXYB2_FULL_37_13 TaxID=1802579 RepID=A0A1F4SDY4_UNCSA|nr:MAG: ABC transporter ATP-binding protein [candidate division WOR-1 bacterium RIFOXYA2_FULL_37_7]OGC18645.1 MAG: ABC transporter ATP-binding protein [candidate division WOR-1 bacterium RIFOXYB2_FULL_37_13]OGC32428.1 MAG: ABC transporter ATP-binding protein [candidate division WOR-1 bacterium RIFOXYC2_FULL_37_10]
MLKYAIEVANMTKKFGSFTAVDNISFTVDKGEIFGFLGPNGAGKTTTIRMLCGLLAPNSGKGIVGGFDISKEEEKIKENIGYMSQKFSLYDDLTVSENIDFYSGIYQTKKETRQEKKEAIIKNAGLLGREKEITAHLSTSIKQHLALGCALIHDPKIVFLDEPTAGVDPISRRKFWKVIKDLSDKGITTLVSTHYMDEAEHCNRIALISGGKIIACDAPYNLKLKIKTIENMTPSLEDVFVFLVEKERRSN